MNDGLNVVLGLIIAAGVAPILGMLIGGWYLRYGSMDKKDEYDAILDKRREEVRATEREQKFHEDMEKLNERERRAQRVMRKDLDEFMENSLIYGVRKVPVDKVGEPWYDVYSGHKDAVIESLIAERAQMDEAVIQFNKQIEEAIEEANTQHEKVLEEREQALADYRESEEDLRELEKDFEYSQDKVREAIRKTYSLLTDAGLTYDEAYAIIELLGEAEI